MGGGGSTGGQRRELGAGHAMGLFTAFVWGSTYPVAKPVVAAVDPLTFSAARYLVASLALLLFLAVSGRPARVRGSDLLSLAALGLLGFTLFQGLWAVALQWTSAANGAVLIATSPIFAALLASLGGERPRAIGWLGIALAFVGVGLLVGKGATPAGPGSESWIGDLLFVAVAAIWALFSACARPTLARLGPVRTTAYSGLFGSLALLLLALPGLARQDWTATPPALALNFFYLAIITGAVGHLTWAGGLQRLGLTRVMLYIYVQPLFGVAIAILLLGERLALLQVLGALAVLGGVVLAQRGAVGPDPKHR